jgi:predicted nucleic acid-binding protein
VIVVDASVLVTALSDDTQEGDRVRARLDGEDLQAPELLGIELVAALRRLTAAGRLRPSRAELALTDYIDLAMGLTPHRPLVARCWELRNNLTPYDAAYVALAELVQVPLVTADRRLASVPGVCCEVEVLE